jgi:hypothetical protein
LARVGALNETFTFLAPTDSLRRDPETHRLSLAGKYQQWPTDLAHSDFPTAAVQI